MSMVQDTLDSIHALLVATLPSTYTVQKHYTSLNSLTIRDYPLAMIFNPEGAGERLPHKQLRKAVGYTIFLVRTPQSTDSPTAHEDMRQEVSDIIDATEADTTLSGVTEDLYTQDWVVDEMQETRTLARMSLAAVRTT